MENKLYLIAELGINASGNLDTAIKMIDAAHDAGFDAVKFQKRTIDQCYTKEFLDSYRDSPWGKTQRDQKRGLEFVDWQYERINDHCREIGIDWSASAWDMESLDFVERFNPPWHKIASPMLGHKPFLRRVASLGRKTFISTGMSRLAEIDEVVKIFRDAGTEFVLLHCNSTYPMPESEANLLMLSRYAARYGPETPLGYSGHEVCLTKVCVAAVALGATVIERHITLDRTAYGSDQAASIECHALRDFVETIRAIPGILGTGEKEVTASEWAARIKLRKEVE
jgi:N-acetylneuraminate synthase